MEFTTTMNSVMSFLESDTSQKLIALFLVSSAILIASALIKRTIPQYIAATDTRYKARRFISFVSFFFIFVAIVFIFNAKLNGFTVFLSVAGAGIAFAVQEVIASIAGFIAINFSNFYKVGDRVSVGGIKGDIIDIGILRTSLMEMGDWVDGDMYNGRITRVANSFVFKEPVHNYSGQFPFLWDEIKIPIKTDGDFDWATQTFQKILQDVQGQYVQQSLKHWNNMKKMYLIEDAQVEPSVHMKFDENWITFTLRYIVDYSKRRSTKDVLYRKLLTAIRNSEGKIEVASAAYEVTQISESE